MTPRAPMLLAAIALLLCLSPLLFACSSERPEGQSGGGNASGDTPGKQSDGAKDEGAQEPSRDAEQPEPPAALVPISHISSTLEDVSTKDLSQARQLAVARGSREEAGGLLDRTEFQSFDSVEAVIDHVSKTPGALGLVPWDEVGPRVKALSVDGESLFDPDSGGAEDYPLKPEGATVPDPGKLRRMVVGGDIVLDRGQYYMVIRRGMGIDFPLDGGYAAVTSRVPEQSAYSETGIIHQFTAERTGGAGAVRKYLSGADLTLANFENPVIRDSVYHPDATTFTGDLRLMPVLDQAGIDGVTLGNNHILDAGTTGLDETMGHLDDAGIAHAGAGMDLAQARKPMVFDVGDTKIGVLSYMGVPNYDWAWATKSAPARRRSLQNLMEEDIERLRPKVDLVVVMSALGRRVHGHPRAGAGGPRARRGRRGGRHLHRRPRALAQGYRDVQREADLLRRRQLPARPILVRRDLDRHLRRRHALRGRSGPDPPRPLHYPRPRPAQLSDARGGEQGATQGLRRVPRTRVRVLRETRPLTRPSWGLTGADIAAKSYPDSAWPMAELRAPNVSRQPQVLDLDH